jgi:hypothetical protein
MKYKQIFKYFIKYLIWYLEFWIILVKCLLQNGDMRIIEEWISRQPK